jgi:ATP-binding cassette, subfamily B, bacterial
MFKQFPFYKQRDAMDCGPTCLMMVAEHYGKQYTLPYLREHCHLSREGVSALGIMQGGEAIGLSSLSAKVSYDKNLSKGIPTEEEGCLLNAPLPCVAHWNQNHFVVIYKVTQHAVWVADPASGKFKLKRSDFERSWLSDNQQGVIILFETSPEFFNKHNPTPSVSTGFSSLYTYLNPYRGLITQLVIAMLLGSLFQLILPFLTQSIVDIGIENQNIGFIYLILAGQVMLFLSQLIVNFIQNRILLHIGTRINVALVSDFLIKLMRLPIGFFDTKMTGDLMQRIGDQSRIESFLTQSSLSIVFSFINFIVFSSVLMLYNPTIFMVFAIAAVCYIAWITLFLRKRKEIDYLRFQQASDNQNTVIELIQGMPEIKLQGSERKRRQLWAGIQAKLFNINLKSLNLGQWQEAGAAFFTQSKDIIITVIAAQAVIEGKMSLGMMMATQYIVGQLNAPLQQFIAFIRAAQDAKISMARLGEIHQQPDENVHAYNPIGLDQLDILRGGVASVLTEPVSTDLSVAALSDKSDKTGSAEAEATLHIENLTFKYNALNDEVLKNISLTIPHGKVTAIVGTSGSGKTTLVKLLLGMYPPTKGSIKIGKINLQNVTPSVWRQHCGAVMQEGYIFSDTIANNIAESDPFVDRRKLLHAVQVANIQEFVETLPLGYNTTIGARGSGISQGQRQRLLIARAVYKNPSFLFFDEATNALDANNERVIVENLAQFFQNRTVVVVAHRLSTVKNADQIVVLEKGEIVEIGTHTELVEKRGAYFNLVKNQLELGS